MGETCIVIAPPFLPAPQAFPYESVTITHIDGVAVRFDIEGDLTFVQGWMHASDDSCTTPASQGGGAEIFAEFDLP